MTAHAKRRYNLVEENWIPVAGEGLVSLQRVFTDAGLTALGGNPVEKIALIKLLLAIAHAAWTPVDDEEWAEVGSDGLASKVADYLQRKKDLFWLYGDSPFLQVPAIKKADIQNFGAVQLSVATGNTTILTESQVEKKLDDSEKALLIVSLISFALGGKKTDNSVVGITG